MSKAALSDDAWVEGRPLASPLNESAGPGYARAMQRGRFLTIAALVTCAAGCPQKVTPEACEAAASHKAALLNGEGEVDDALAMMNQELLEAFKTDCKAGKLDAKVIACVQAAKTAAETETCETSS